MLKEEKFNLKTIIYFFILIDLFLLPFGMLEVIWWLAIYQISIVVSLMVGLKGQGRYKQAMGELQSIARDTNLTVDEREHMLVMQIHHQMLELGYIYVERNKKQFKKVKKKTKNLEVKKRMIWDEVVWKQFGYMIVGIWGFLGIGLFDLLINFMVLSMLWIWVVTGIWYCLNVFIFFYIHYVFNIEPNETPKID